MKLSTRLLLSLLCYSLTGFGISLTILADIGVSSYNAMNLSLAGLLSLKIGTMTIIVNSLFLLAYIILTKGKKIGSYLLQALSVFCLGFVINFFTYDVLGSIVLTHYVTKVIVFISGAIIGGIGTGMVLNLKLLSFPIESVCECLEARTSFSFAQLRYSVDVFSITLSILISLVIGGEFYVREGTLISLLLLSFIISQTKRIYQHFYPSVTFDDYKKATV